MVKYAKVIDNKTGKVDVGLGSNDQYYKNKGFLPMDVEQAYDGQWYLNGYAPIKPEETDEQKLLRLENEYGMPRLTREGILGNTTAYSEFNAARAKELEALAEKIRNKGETI